MPGCRIRHTFLRQTLSGIARFRNGATIRSGRNSATASSVTESAMSNSTDTSCPRVVSSTYSRCVRLLKLRVRKRMRIVSMPLPAAAWP